jgi:hypothetical protein
MKHMQKDDKRHDRPESYPKPTEVDSMLQQQDEFNENLNTQSSSHNPMPDSEPPQIKRMPSEDPDSDDK